MERLGRRTNSRSVENGAKFLRSTKGPPRLINEVSERNYKNSTAESRKSMGSPLRIQNAKKVNDFKKPKRKKIAQDSEGTSPWPEGDASSETNNDHGKDPDSSNRFVTDGVPLAYSEDIPQLGTPIYTSM